MTSNEIILETQVEHDTYTEIAEKMFDIPLEDRMRTTIINNIRPPEDWSIGCIYGQSVLSQKYGCMMEPRFFPILLF